MKSNTGVTLVELLLVVALVAILAASSAPFLSNFILQNRHQTTLERVLGSLRQAQIYAMSGKNNDTWGVCLTDSIVRMYQGSCGSPAYKEDYQLTSTITLTGLSDVSFDKRGEPSVAQSITVSSAIDSNTVTLNSVGRIQIE